MYINILKRIGIVLGSLYLLFLILPFALSPVLNSNTAQIEKMLAESTGYNVKLGKLSVLTTPKLTVGIKASNVEFFIPTNEKFLDVQNLKAKVSILPLLIGRIEADIISADSVVADLKVRQDGHFLIEEYLPKADPDKQAEPLKPLWFFKLSNHLPNIVIKKYDLAFVNMQNSQKYSIAGEDFKITDFILDKKIKLSTKGKYVSDDYEQFIYDIKIFNKLMPDLSLNDLVFNPNIDSEQTDNNSCDFNILNILTSLKSTGLRANLVTDLKISGSFSEPEITGLMDVNNFTLKIDNEFLPESSLNLTANSHNLKTNVNLYTAKDELTTIVGNFTTNKHKKIDMRAISHIQLNNLFKIVNSLAKSFGINDFETLSAKGSMDADFSLKVKGKHVDSDGYLKIPNAELSYKLYNIVIKNIVADIDFNDKMNIKNIGFSVLNQPFRVFGTIEQNSDADITMVADNLPLKELVAMAGQVSLLKDNTFNSGVLSLNATLKGKISEIIPNLDVLISNVDIKNKPSNSRIVMPSAKFVLNTDNNKYSGDLKMNNLKILNPMMNVVLPDTKISIGEKNIDIVSMYLLLNNSRIDVTGSVKDYLNNKIKILVDAKGAILASDINSMLPKELRSAYSGKLPLSVKVDGDSSTQNIFVNLTADSKNYVSILKIDALNGKTMNAKSNMILSNNSLKFVNTGILAGSQEILTLSGSVDNLAKTPLLNLKMELPKTLSMPVPMFNKSKMSVRGNVDVTGSINNPHLNGLISVPNLTIDDMDLKINNLVANLNGAIMNGNATVQSMAFGKILVENIASEFSLKNYNMFYLTNIFGDVFNGKISGNISYNLLNGKIGVNLSGSKMSALKAIEDAAGIKNALSGELSFTTNVTTQGATDVEIMKNLAGNAKFDITNGKFLNVGRFDNLLYAQNILGNAILKAAVTSVTNLPIIQNTAEFKSVNGNLSFKNGWVYLHPVTSTGPLMAYYITGRYNLLNATTNAVILGRLDEKVVSVLGPLGDLSVDRLTAYIPKFGALTSALIKSFTSDPRKENVANIPQLSSGSKNYKDFKVEYNGGVQSRTSVKSFKWLSQCDTSAIDIKKELNNVTDNVRNSVNSVKQDYANTRDALQNTVRDTKQQFETTKNELKNLFKF